MVHRFAALLLATLLLAGCKADSTSTGPSTDSATHWLMRCEADNECGEGLDCLCGLCTVPCQGSDDCELGGMCIATDGDA